MNFRVAFFISRGVICSFLLLGLHLLSAQETDYFPGKEWRTSAPAAQGMNEAKISTFISQLRAGKIQRPISSFLIVKNGYLVVNETFNGFQPNAAHTLQSVTKSITATLVAVAIQKGFIDKLDQKLLSFFPEYKKIAHMDEYKKAISLRDVLTMRTGQAWTGERHLGPLNNYPGDRMKYVLDYKMQSRPGRTWYYNSGIAILLGGLLRNATGMPTQDFAQKYLFEPMQIRNAAWHWSHKGIPHTGGGLFLKPEDMAKIGYLYLRNGRWNDKQILPSWWVDKATARHVNHTQNIAGCSQISYGYMWWLLNFDPRQKTNRAPEIYMAYGHWGQFIFIIPKYDMVVVFINNDSASYAEEVNPLKLFYQRVLPAVKN